MPNPNPFLPAMASVALACLAFPAHAQDAPLAPTQQQAASADAPIADGAEARCRPAKKKKKGFGLGGLLKAARASGLTNVAGMGGLGRGGALANAAIGTAASVAEAAATEKAAREAADGC